MKNILQLILIIAMATALPVAAQQAKPRAASLKELLNQVRQGRVGKAKRMQLANDNSSKPKRVRANY